MDPARSDCFLVKPNGHGEKSTYSKFGYQPGEVVYLVRGEAISQRSRHSIEVGPGEHVEDSYAQFINHSFTPNLEVRGRRLIAIAAIAQGDELTFNYLASESEIAAPFVCHETGEEVSSTRCQPRGDR